MMRSCFYQHIQKWDVLVKDLPALGRYTFERCVLKYTVLEKKIHDYVMSQRALIDTPPGSVAAPLDRCFVLYSRFIRPPPILRKVQKKQQF